MPRPAPARVIPNPASRRASAATSRLVPQRNKRSADAQFTHPWCEFPSIAYRATLAAKVAAGSVPRSSFSLKLFAVLGSTAIFAHGAATRDLRAPFSPRRPRARETAAMATQYFARPKLQLFGVSTAFVVRKIGLSDLSDALRLGWEDFKAIPTHAVVLCVIYPVLGLVLFRMVLGHSLLPLLFPLAAGFTLIGPFAGLGLYELSRRRERGEEPSAMDALHVLRAPSFGAILGLGMFLLVLFGIWIAAADGIYVATFGYAPAASMPDFA